MSNRDRSNRALLCLGDWIFAVPSEWVLPSGTVSIRYWDKVMAERNDVWQVMTQDPMYQAKGILNFQATEPPPYSIASL